MLWVVEVTVAGIADVTSVPVGVVGSSTEEEVVVVVVFAVVDDVVVVVVVVVKAVIETLGGGCYCM